MKRELTEQEIQQWQREIADVQQLKLASKEAQSDGVTDCNKVDITSAKQYQSSVTATAATRAIKPYDQQVKYYAASNKTALRPIICGEVVGIDGNMAKRFKKGKMAIEGSLDLHGCNLTQAAGIFTQYIASSRKQGLRVVRIITGHAAGRGGEGALRAELPKWVNLPENHQHILAFIQAPPEQGGKGAVLLLLRKAENNSDK